MRTIRTKQMKFGNILFAIMEGAVTDFALILTIAAVIVIDILMWSTTEAYILFPLLHRQQSISH